MKYCYFVMGDTYESNIDLTAKCDITTVPSAPASVDTSGKDLVFFDLETTGLGQFLIIC